MQPQLDWSTYDAKIQATRNTKRIRSDAGKARLENIAANAVSAALTPGNARILGYGNDAVTILVQPPHAYDRLGGVVVKVLDKNPRHYYDFHLRLGETLATLGTRFQKTADVKTIEGQQVQVLEYIPGDNLDVLAGQQTTDKSHRVLDQFVLEILIPAWDKGLRFFDFRNANLVYGSRGLGMVDLDMLSKNFSEVGTTTWTRRDVLERAAVRRLPQTIAKLLDLGGLSVSPARIKTALSGSRLEENLRLLGRGRSDADARACYRDFLGLLGVSRNGVLAH